MTNTWEKLRTSRHMEWESISTETDSRVASIPAIKECSEKDYERDEECCVIIRTKS